MAHYGLFEWISDLVHDAFLDGINRGMEAIQEGSVDREPAEDRFKARLARLAQRQLEAREPGESEPRRGPGRPRKLEGPGG
jgi:hypothetical protein